MKCYCLFMSTLFVSHPDCLAHVTPPGHPERVERLERILAVADAAEFAGLDRAEAPLAEDRFLLLAHAAAYLREVAEAIPEKGFRSLDADTHVSPGSLTAARRAAGAVVMAVDTVMSGEAQNAFCAVRPPGHHAERARAMGFCIFGNAAIGALHALENHGLSRVAILDFDVHHGNGTQALVWNDARILYGSTHQMPLYPGSGGAHETGEHGQVVNAPLAPLSGGAEFRRAMEDRIFPAVRRHDPGLIIISAGFDAHERDPLANLNLTAEDFAWATAEICDLAAESCGGRVVSTLEGGYDLEALGASVAAHLGVLTERGE